MRIISNYQPHRCLYEFYPALQAKKSISARQLFSSTLDLMDFRE
jgi:hypothetical protein